MFTCLIRSIRVNSCKNGHQMIGTFFSIQRMPNTWASSTCGTTTNLLQHVLPVVKAYQLAQAYVEYKTADVSSVSLVTVQLVTLVLVIVVGHRSCIFRRTFSSSYYLSTSILPFSNGTDMYKGKNSLKSRLMPVDNAA